ncbi:MAG: DUF6794 domain-containing protein [Pseudomonadota bacterium]
MRALLLAGALAMVAAPVFAQDEPDPVGVALRECAPANYFAAVDCLETHLEKESLETLRTDGAVMAHFGLGMWLRNNWGLWGGSPLQSSLVEQGFVHPDDMSAAILDGLVARLRGEEFDLEAAIEGYAQYWEGASQTQEVECKEKHHRDDPKVKCFINGNGDYYAEFKTDSN